MVPQQMTFRDAIDQVDDFLGGTAQSATQRDVRASIQRAYVNLVKTRKWRSLNRETRIVTQAPFSSGTVSYSSASNTMVLSGATWPAWASQGSVLTQNVISDIVSVDDDGVTANLDGNIKPDTDIPAGTSFQLFQDQYPLPPDFHLADMPIAEGFLRAAMYVEPQQYMAMKRMRMSSGTPSVWSVMPSTRYMGLMVLCLAPWPDAVFSEDMVYTGRGRPLKYTGYGATDTGTFSGATGSNVVIATNGVFLPDMIGSIFRARLDGITPDGVFGLNQYTEQRVVSEYLSPTQVALDANLQTTYANCAYVVSDPIDLPPHMVEPFICMAQYQVSLQRKMDPAEVAKAREAYNFALLDAQNADASVAQKRSCYDLQPWAIGRRIARFPYSNTDTG